MRTFRDVGITILIAVALFFFLRAAVQGYTVHYSSMLPNIEEGEWIMVNKASYFFSDPQRGDVIVLDPPIPSNYPFIKRVIGLPNETVEVRDGEVFINSIPIDEPYTLSEPLQHNRDFGPQELSDIQYFVMGDNRNGSNDSRSWGPIERDDIIGKAWFIYWPQNKWGVIKHYNAEPAIEAEPVAVCVPATMYPSVVLQSLAAENSWRPLVSSDSGSRQHNE